MVFPLLITAVSLTAQTTASHKAATSKAPAAVTKMKGAPGNGKKPKLVVGIVIDQMRWDYLYRFADLYGTGGFKRMQAEGFSCENTLIPYMPTYTAPGHACVYTGSVPALHGIAGNNWFDKLTGKNVYCTDDSTVSTVGSNSSAGKMSPRNMWSTTITDELRLSNNFKSKVIGIALKDRGSILPAGHTANAAYWYDAGKWITSTYYMKELPAWVQRENAKDLPGKYMQKDWNTLLPIEKYDGSSADDTPFEQSISGEETVTFPHKTSLFSTNKYDGFKYTPYAATYTFDFAKAAIDNEQLGAGTVTDFLALSISSTDYIGHNFGPNSIEVEDAYLRLDLDIADFLKYLDKKLGKGNYLTFLTADHGVGHIPAFLAEHNLPGGTVSSSAIQKDLNDVIEKETGIKKGVLTIQNYQVFLNMPEIENQKKDLKEVMALVVRKLKLRPEIVSAVYTDGITSTSLPAPQKQMFDNGYNPKRSGEILFTFKPGYFEGGNKGTTHGLWNPYDAHIPLLFFGWQVPHGKTHRETYMTDIAATIAAMLQVQMPNSNVGKVILEVMP